MLREKQSEFAYLGGKRMAKVRSCRLLALRVYALTEVLQLQNLFSALKRRGWMLCQMKPLSWF